MGGKTTRNHRRFANCQGFSLIELILVIVIVGIAAVPLMNGFMTMGSWLDTPIESVPAGAQLAQECAEHITALRRKDDYAGVASTSCNGLPALPAGYSRTVTVTARTSATLSACPAGTNCKEVSIAVTKGGVTVGRATLMLVEY